MDGLDGHFLPEFYFDEQPGYELSLCFVHYVTKSCEQTCRSFSLAALHQQRAFWGMGWDEPEVWTAQGVCEWLN